MARSRGVADMTLMRAHGFHDCSRLVNTGLSEKVIGFWKIMEDAGAADFLHAVGRGGSK